MLKRGQALYVAASGANCFNKWILLQCTGRFLLNIMAFEIRDFGKSSKFRF